MKTYSDKLKDPRWQRKRLEVMQRDNFKCSQCNNGDITLNVHHWQYSKEPWDAKNEDLTTVCHLCHKEIEHCKDLTKNLLREREFRGLLSNIERLILKNKAVKVIDFDNCVTVFNAPDYQSPLPSSAYDSLYDFNEISQYGPDEKGYRYLRHDESYRIGDERLYSGEEWEVITRVGEDTYVWMCPDTKYRRKTYEDELSDFDRLIESSPEEDKYKI